MSRIGKKPIKLAEGIAVEVNDGNLVTVKGPKGSLSEQIDPDISVNVEDGILTVSRPTEQKRHKALHGLYRSLINNMVEGVSAGYKKELELVGVGYKATAQGKVLELSLGHSHSIFFQIPEELKISTETQKGKNPIVTLEGIDKHQVAQKN